MEPNPEESEKSAFLRFHRHNQCILSFHVEHKSEIVGNLCEDIQTVRQDTETVDALLEHTRKKILKIIKDNKEKEGNVSEEGEAQEVELNLSLRNKNNAVNGHNLLKTLLTIKKLYFYILNVKYSVIVNSPSIELVKLPAIIYCEHKIQPDTFKTTLLYHELSGFWWYKSQDKSEWIEVGNKFRYHVSREDIGYYLKLKCLPKNQTHEGPVYEVISDRAVLPMPETPKCPFDDRQVHTPTYLNGNQFRVVSYNVLSSRYTYDQYEYCPLEYLSIDYRKTLLIKELLGYKADILCLQEVDLKVFSSCFNVAFKAAGYCGIYDKKGNRMPEGLGLFYNKSRFSRIKNDQIVINLEVKKNTKLRSILRLIESDAAACEMFMRQPTSMQYCKLKSKNTNEIIIVANTHLYYHPDANNVRLLQIAVCLEYLKHLHNNEVRNNNGFKVSVIFCGDFNSKPKSEVFNFLTKGVIQYNGEDSSRKCPTTIFHPFQFESACGTPPFTNYTDDFKECLDYIFYDNLTLIGDVPLPEEDVLSKNVALPSEVFPSDHIALVADLKFN